MWPKETKKKKAIRNEEGSRPLLLPNEPYVLVKRLTSKEERKRVVAAVLEPARIPGDYLGLENHVNYFHASGRGMPLRIARGLAVFLNSTLVDTYFRTFNGHTQVNATDLRSLKYPTLEELAALGERVGEVSPAQDVVDQLIEGELLKVPSCGVRWS